MNDLKKPSGFVLVGLSVLFCIVFVALLMLVSPIKNSLPLPYERFAYGLIGTILAGLISMAFIKVHGQRFVDIGLAFTKQAVPKFLVGVAVGLLISFILYSGLVLLNGLKVSAVSGMSIVTFLLSCIVFIPLALMEEMAFRGYAFVNLQKAIGIRGTQFIIALLFALYHVVGGQSWESSFSGPFVWSFLFGLAAWRSRGIAFATGIHMAANMFLAAIGQKHHVAGIFVLDFPGEVNTAVQNKLEHSALILQVALLILTWVCMEYFIRKDKITSP